MGAASLDSAFDDTKPYVLTAMGNEFVHYTIYISYLKDGMKLLEDMAAIKVNSMTGTVR
jgi:hypothetical protein